MALAREPCFPIGRHARAVEKRRGSPIAHRCLRFRRTDRIGPFGGEPLCGVRHQGRASETDLDLRHAFRILWIPDGCRQIERQPGMGLQQGAEPWGEPERRKGEVGPHPQLPSPVAGECAGSGGEDLERLLDGMRILSSTRLMSSMTRRMFRSASK